MNKRLICLRHCVHFMAVHWIMLMVVGMGGGGGGSGGGGDGT